MTLAVKTLAILALLMAAPACSEQLGKNLADEGDAQIDDSSHRLTGQTMGTVWHARVWLKDDVSAEQVRIAIAAAVDEIDALMSTYKDDSDLSRFNRAPANVWVEVSPLTLEVAKHSFALAKLTDGAFDPTVMPLVDAWSFGPGPRRTDAPSQERIASALKLVNWKLLEYRDTPPSLRKKIAGVELDFSAIAKGFGADYSATAARTAGATAALIEVGGELVVFGQKPRQQAWKVAIESPKAGDDWGAESQVLAVLPAPSALATSGNYRNWREVDGEIISHTIDPRNGLPVRHQLISASIQAPDCMTADALATAAMVLGSDQTRKLLEQLPSVEYFLIIKQGEHLTTEASSGFRFAE